MKDLIVQDGDPVLRAKAEPVAAVDIHSRKIKSVIKRMKEALSREEFGVAIAAPQIGEPLRMFVVAGRAFNKPEEEDEHGLVEAEPTRGPAKKTPQAREDMVFINPQLMRLSKSVAEMSEGCLSVRHKYGTVIRHEKATVKALDENGKPFTYHGTGLVAHIFQHEYDHLEGILYTDKAVTLEEDHDWQKTGKKSKAARPIS